MQDSNGTVGKPDNLGGRLPLLDPKRLTTQQRHLYERLVASRVPEAASGGFIARLDDGRFIGPFNGFLHVPAIGEGLLAWADAIAKSGLPKGPRWI